MFALLVTDHAASISALRHKPGKPVFAPIDVSPLLSGPDHDFLRCYAAVSTKRNVRIKVKLLVGLASSALLVLHTKVEADMSYSNNNNPEASAAGAVIVMLLAVAATIIALLPIVYPLAGAILLVIAGIDFAVVALGIEIFFKNIDSQTVITIAGIFTFIVVTVMAYPVVKAAEYSVSANPIYRRFRLLWRVIVAPSVSIGLVVIFKDSMGLSDAAIVLAPSVALILTLVFSLVPSCSIERLVEENA